KRRVAANAGYSASWPMPLLTPTYTYAWVSGGEFARTETERFTMTPQAFVTRALGLRLTLPEPPTLTSSTSLDLIKQINSPETRTVIWSAEIAQRVAPPDQFEEKISIAREAVRNAADDVLARDGKAEEDRRRAAGSQGWIAVAGNRRVVEGRIN